MRQLKFRLWDKTEKCWANPSYMEVCGDDDNVGVGTLMCLFDYKNQERWEIQQFTGEYDKNNKPIYEGDIIKSTSEEFINENYVAEVVFIDATFDAKINDKEYAGLWSGDDIEVIGNIFENENLLA